MRNKLVKNDRIAFEKPYLSGINEIVLQTSLQVTSG